MLNFIRSLFANSLKVFYKRYVQTRVGVTEHGNHNNYTIEINLGDLGTRYSDHNA